MYLDREFHRLLSVNNSVRVMPKMKPVLFNINSQIHRANLKLSKYNGYHTPGFTMLLNCIYRGVTSGLEDYPNDFTKLYEYLEAIRSSLSRSFASTGGGGAAHSKYFIYSKLCKEYIFSVEPRNLADSYPIDKGKDAWKRYRAFRMVDIDSNDFTLNISSGLLAFTKHLPKFAMFTFDPVAAILQYYNLKDEVSLEQYVHQYLIMPALTLDYIRLWMLGNYSQWFVSRSRDYRDIPMITSSYAQIPVSLDSAMKDIGDLIDEGGHLGVSKILSSLPLPYNTSVSKYATRLYNKSSLDDISEYDWGTFMIYRRMLDVCIRAMSATINSTDTRNQVYTLRRAIMQLARGNILSGINDSYTRYFVRSSVDSLERQAIELYNIAKDT